MTRFTSFAGSFIRFAFIASLAIVLMPFIGSTARASLLTTQYNVYSNSDTSFGVTAGPWYSWTTGQQEGSMLSAFMTCTDGVATSIEVGFAKTTSTTGSLYMYFQGMRTPLTQVEPYTGTNLSVSDPPLTMVMSTGSEVFDTSDGKGVAAPADMPVTALSNLRSSASAVVNVGNMVLDGTATGNYGVYPGGVEFYGSVNFPVKFTGPDAAQIEQAFAQAVNLSSTPEPGSIGLILLGSCGLLLRRRRAVLVSVL